MEGLRSWMEAIEQVLDLPLITMGQTQIRLWSVFYLAVLLALLFYFTGKVRRWLVRWLVTRSTMDEGARESAGQLARYVLLVIGFLIIIQTAGIDLTSLNVILGAVGIGVGLGLQNIATNFISGLIILFERPIKLRDRIVVGNVEGDVVRIGARSTTVVTNDNISIIIPNSKFIMEDVVNWSHSDEVVRFKFPVSVAYGSDVRLVEKLLLEVAREDPDIRDDPPPVVRFLEFGDSGLHFELRGWSNTLIRLKGRLISQVNFAIDAKFRKHGVQIPFPQRDLHLKSGFKGLDS